MKIKIYHNIAIVFVGLSIIIPVTGCKKFIEIDPPVDKITEANVFESDATAAAALTGIYSNLSLWPIFQPDLLTISKLAGLSADELSPWSGASPLEIAYYENSLQTNVTGAPGVVAGEEMWIACYSYRYLYQCNQSIKGISASKSLTPSVKQQLLGEAKFLRAFFYFYLVNLYGDVPLVTGVDPEENRSVARTPVAEVYNLIVSDLKDAKELLSSSFLYSDLKTITQERIRPTKWAATALLARVYLYQKKYQEAEQEATTVINQSTLFDVASVPLNDVFLKNSKEAIWQIQPVSDGMNTVEGSWFLLNSVPNGFDQTKSVYLNPALFNSFEPGDDRKVNWVDTYTTGSPATSYYFPNKYKAGFDPAITPTTPSVITEYEMVLRLAEQYLIRAEARAQQGNTIGAIADINVIRTRARSVPTPSVPNPLPDLSSGLTQSQILDTVLHERQVELFTEWGHRWLDLKRTNKVDAVMSIVTPLKGGTWNSTDQLYPIPFSDIQKNSHLIQNPGY